MKKTLLVLLILSLFAFGIRIFKLDVLRLTHDEMSLGYNAYSILKTGKDEWGKSFPLSFRAFGDYKLPLYIYSAVPFIAVFGLTELAVKLPSLFAGVILLLAVYHISLELGQKKSSAFFAAIIIAVSPVTIHFSRSALEANLTLTIFATAFYFLLLGLRRKERWQLILSGFMFGLTLYGYIAYRLLVPLFLVASAYLLYKKKKLRLFLPVFVSFVLVIGMLIPQYLDQSGTARFSQTSIFQNEGIVNEIDDKRSFCYLSSEAKRVVIPMCRIWYNKPLVFARVFAHSYVTSLSPKYLFLTGDERLYLSNPNFGSFYLLFLPLYLVGLTSFIRKKNLGQKLLLTVFLLSPIATSLSGEAQLIRVSAVILPATLLMSYGFERLLALLKSYRLQVLSVSSVILAFVTISFLIQNYYIYPYKYEDRFYGYGPELADHVNSIKNDYEYIQVNDQIPDSHILFAFYGAYDPTWYRENVVRPEPDDYGFSHPTGLEQFSFGVESLGTFLCDESKSEALYVDTKEEGYEEMPHILFKNFSGVHTQAIVIDVKQYRQELVESGAIEAQCK